MDKRGGNTWHTTEDWHYSPLLKGSSRALTVPPGRGGGALEAPRDRHRQDHRTGTSRAEQMTEAMAELGALEAMAVQGALEAMAVQGAQEAMVVQGAQEAMAGGACGRGLGPLGPAPTAGTLSTPPKKKFPGEVRGIRSPPGLNTDTGQDSPPGLDTRQHSPPVTGSPPGLARKLRLLLGMTRSQGPSQGPSATASTSTTRGQAAGNGLRGHYKKSRLPQTSLHGQDRQDTLKLFLRARQYLKTMTLGTWHGTPGRDVDWIHGARVSSDRWAWVSGDPAGLSKRRAGGHWVSGGPVAWSPANGRPGGAATRELENQPVGLG